MKKLLSLIIVFYMLLGSCENIPNDGSQPSIEESSDIIGESSIAEESSDVNSNESEEEILPPPTEIFSETTVAENKKNTIISNGASYTYTKESAEEYPDVHNSELTDGVFDESITSFYHESLSGYLTRNQTIQLDLGDYYRNIYKFNIAAFLDTSAGISSNLKIDAYLSLDGKNWKLCGTLEQPKNPKMSSVNIISLELDKYANAHYVKFVVVGSNSWIFLQEISVIADVEDKQSGAYAEAVKNTYSDLGANYVSLSGESVNYNLNKTNIAKNKRYTIDTPRNANYIDVDGKMLTDGIATGVLSEEGWVGFDGGKDITVVIDLAENAKDIASIEASFYVNKTLKEFLPTALSISALDADKNETSLGIVYGSDYVDSGNFVFVIPFDKCVSARYVQIKIHSVADSLVLLEEIGVYAYRRSSEPRLYPEVVIQTGGEVNPNGVDQYKNLILNRTQQIYVAVNTDHQMENNSKVTDKTLTDGIYSNDFNIHNGQFFKFCSGDTRSVIYDLEYICAVDKFTASFCHQESWAVYAPKQVMLYASENGKEWYEIGEMSPESTAKEGIYQCEMKLPKAVKARYVAFSFSINTWLGCDELQVFGNEVVANAVNLADEGYKYITVDAVSGKRKEPSDDLLGGSRQLCLLYHSPTNGYTQEQLLPYVAYLDEDGNIKDTMFDSFLFLHSTGNFPSGNSPFSGSTWADWQWSIEDLFAQGENLYALEAAAGQVKTALGLPDDFTYKVTMTIYYPTVENCKNFGDFDGDGKNDDLTIYENRIKATKKYIDQIETRFKQSGFKNIELVGYYWWHEGINGSTPEEDIKQLLNEISDYIHTKDKDFFWIPYFTASGFSQWEEYGFDIACMQPNYVFEGERPISNLYNNEKFTRYYGMGVEMEIFEGSLSNLVYFKRYMDYIRVGAESGYMTDTVNMYYQSFLVFHDACHSPTTMGRMIYDTTYDYIKGRVNPIPKQLDDLTLTAQRNSPAEFEIDYDTEKLKEIRLISMPQNGTVTFNPDGSFVFYPAHDFVGETSFTFAYSEYLSFSEPITVTITVE